MEEPTTPMMRPTKVKMRIRATSTITRACNQK